MNTTALIVTFNRLEKLKICWAAVSGQKFNHIVIVDNASTDGTYDWLCRIHDPRLTILRNENNNGGAGGFKRGAEYIVADPKTDWVFLFDDDAYPAADLLDKFSTVSHLNYDAYCCKVTDKEGNVCKMNLPYIKMPSSFSETVSYLLNAKNYVPDGTCAIDVVTFSFVGAVIKKTVLRHQLTNLWPALFIYYDDLYFSYSLSQQGYRIRYSPELNFVHDVVLQQKGITPAWKVYYLVRNLLLSGKLFKKTQRPYSFPAITLRLIKYLFSFFSQDEKAKYINYVIKGIFDGLRGKSGKRH